MHTSHDTATITATGLLTRPLLRPPPPRSHGNTALKAHMEASLKDHIRRHFGEAAAAAATVAGLANGTFDPYSYRAGGGKKAVATVGGKGGKEVQEKDGRKHGHVASASGQQQQQQAAGSGPASPQAKRARKESSGNGSANGNGVAHVEPAAAAVSAPVVVAAANGVHHGGAITAEVEVQMSTGKAGSGKGGKAAAANGGHVRNGKASGVVANGNGFHRSSSPVANGRSDVKAYIRTEALVS